MLLLLLIDDRLLLFASNTYLRANISEYAQHAEGKEKAWYEGKDAVLLKV